MKKTILILAICLLFTVSGSAQTMDCQPKLSTKAIRSFLKGRTLKEVPALSGGGETEWTFEPKELVEIDIVETSLEEKKAVSVIEIKTGTASGYLVIDKKSKPLPASIIEGRLRLSFELVAGEWSLLKIENLSVKWREQAAEIVDEDS